MQIWIIKKLFPRNLDTILKRKKWSWWKSKLIDQDYCVLLCRNSIKGKKVFMKFVHRFYIMWILINTLVNSLIWIVLDRDGNLDNLCFFLVDGFLEGGGGLIQGASEFLRRWVQSFLQNFLSTTNFEIDSYANN